MNGSIGNFNRKIENIKKEQKGNFITKIYNIPLKNISIWTK